MEEIYMLILNTYNFIILKLIGIKKIIWKMKNMDVLNLVHFLSKKIKLVYLYN